MKHFSPKFRKLSKQDKITSFIKFANTHKVIVNGTNVTDTYYSEGEDSIFFNSCAASITSIKGESIISAKIDGHVISGSDEFGKFEIEFFNLTPASITL